MSRARPLRWAATCADCGARLEPGDLAVFYGRGRVFGRRCHTRADEVPPVHLVPPPIPGVRDFVPCGDGLIAAAVDVGAFRSHAVLSLALVARVVRSDYRLTMKALRGGALTPHEEAVLSRLLLDADLSFAPEPFLQLVSTAAPAAILVCPAEAFIAKAGVGPATDVESVDAAIRALWAG